MKVTDEMLMAYADGELEEATASDVARAIEADPALARRLAEFAETRMLAKRAFGDVLDEPVPERLLAGLSRGGARNSWRLPTLRLWLPVGAALAASIAGFVVGTGVSPDIGTGPALIPGGPAIVALLDTAPSGEPRALPDDRTFQATGSYAVPEGICRAFTVSGDAAGWRGVGCHHGAGWAVELAIADSAAADGSFQTASDRATQAIDTFLDAVGAGATLDDAAEADFLARGWVAEDQPDAE